MDREQQAERIQRIVNAIAERSLAVPPDVRPAYIQEEVAKVREAFCQTYEADARLAAYAMEFVDAMAGWIEARVHTLEKGIRQSRGSGEGSAK
jgi:hypothetical protein